MAHGCAGGQRSQQPTSVKDSDTFPLAAQPSSSTIGGAVCGIRRFPHRIGVLAAMPMESTLVTIPVLRHSLLHITLEVYCDHDPQRLPRSAQHPPLCCG